MEMSVDISVEISVIISVEISVENSVGISVEIVMDFVYGRFGGKTNPLRFPFGFPFALCGLFWSFWGTFRATLVSREDRGGNLVLAGPVKSSPPLSLVGQVLGQV